LIELIAEARACSEKENLAFEAKLHQQFDQWRKPETEIFCFTPAQVEQVKAAMTPTTLPGQQLGMACLSRVNQVDVWRQSG
ncbi:MAG: hypothetical protein RLZZ186_1857, partial [Cyanobacteriota bacterium]|jgi:hypothetical protein